MSITRVRAGSFSFQCVNGCGPASGRDTACRPAVSRYGRLICNRFGPLARGLFRASNAFQGSARGLSDLFRSFLSAVRHERNHDGRIIGNVRNSSGEIRNVER